MKSRRNVSLLNLPVSIIFNRIHNALGQRAKKSTSGADVVYIYDLFGNLIAEHDNTGATIRDYAWLDGAPVAQIDQGEVFSYLHFDHLGTPRTATNEVQTIGWRWDSDTFGAVLPDEDPDGDSNDMTINLRFPGQYYDDETGLLYNYHRTYDPSTGRYLESDPIGLAGGLNTYSYVRGNPLRYFDIFGLSEQDVREIRDAHNRVIEQLNESGQRKPFCAATIKMRGARQSMLENGSEVVPNQWPPRACVNHPGFSGEFLV